MLEETINGIVQNPDHAFEVYEMGQCLKVGVLTNPRSGGNKKGLGEIRNILARSPNVLHREAFDPGGMDEALVDFAEHGVDLIVVNGGDGTAHAVLTIIGRGELFATPPLLALLCAGTTSMLPRDVGIKESSASALSRVLAWADSTDGSLTVLQRPILKVQRAANQPHLFGMFFGAGAICQGIKVFHSGVNPMGWRGEIMPGLTILRMLLAILRKEHDKVPPILTKTRLDHGAVKEGTNLCVLMSTLERLFLGMRPYWGTENGPLHYTAVDVEPKKLLRIIPSLFGWQKNRYATAANGFFSHNVHEVQLEISGEFTLDGELYDVGQGPMTISTTEPVLFLCTG